MENLLSKMDISIVRNMMHTKSAKDIALVIGAPIDQVNSALSELSASLSVSSFETKRLAKALLKQKKVKPSKIKKETASVLKVVRQRDEKRKDEEHKALKKHFSQYEADQKAARLKRKDSQLFKTRHVDYSQLVSVRIDRKTIIYSKPGEEAATKEKFLKNYKPSLEKNAL